MMNNLNFKKRLLKRISSIFPYLLLIIAGAGFAVAFILGGNSPTITSLIYVIPVILAAIILLLRRRINELSIPTYISRLSFLNLFLLSTFLFILSLIILVTYSTRQWSYFFIVSIISGVIFVQIIHKRPAWTDYLIIVEIVFFSLNIIWGVSLKYPLYFGWTDILAHLSNIEIVLRTAHVEGLNPTYQYFPSFHIYTAIGSNVTGLSSRTALFIFMGLAWQVGILFAYLIFYKFSNSRRFSLVACILFALSSEIIFYGSYAITRSLAFVMLLCWFYLILKKPDIKYILLVVIAMWALILTHHVTVLFSIPVLIGVYLFQRYFSFNKSDWSRAQLIYILLLVVSYLAYIFLFAHTFVDNVIVPYLSSINSTEMPFFIGTGTKSTSLILVYYSFVLFFSLIGIGTAIKNSEYDNKHHSLVGIALISLLFLPFYVVGPLNQIAQLKDLLLYRMPLLVSPFIIYIIAYGLNYFLLLERNNSYHLHERNLPVPLLTVGLIILMTFSSMIFGNNAQDNSYILKHSNAGSEYFTTSELVSFSYLEQNGNLSSILYGDAETTANIYSLGSFQEKQILKSGDTNSIQDGYLLLRIGELNRRGGLSFSLGGTHDQIYGYYSKPQAMLENLSFYSKIYGDGDVLIFMTKSK